LRYQGLKEQEATETTEEQVSVSSAFSVFNDLSMHALFNQASGITRDVIGAAIEVHKDKGPGLLESVYEWCLTMELGMRDFQVENQSEVVVRYKQFQRTVALRFDLLVNRCLLVEVKAIEAVLPIHKAQLLSYMKLLDIPLGLIINFNSPKLTDDVSRLILPGANLD
jgi:GxxExxY protein